MIHAFKHPIPKPDDRHSFFFFRFFYSLFILSDIELCSTFEYDLIILLICYSIVLLNVSSRIRNRTFPFHTHHGRRWEKVFVINLKGGGGLANSDILWKLWKGVIGYSIRLRENLIKRNLNVIFFLLVGMRWFLLLYLYWWIFLFGALAKLLYQLIRLFWRENKFYLGACLCEELTYLQKQRFFVIFSQRQRERDE